MKILKMIACLLAGHNWTCHAREGIKPTEEQIKSVNGFIDYAKMYCKRCGTYSELNGRLNIFKK